MFKFKAIADKQDKTFGILLRVFGVDISVLLLAYYRDWRVLDFRLPCNYGVYAQVWFALVSIGRLPNEGIYEL